MIRYIAKNCLSPNVTHEEKTLDIKVKEDIAQSVAKELAKDCIASELKVKTHAATLPANARFRCNSLMHNDVI